MHAEVARVQHRRARRTRQEPVLRRKAPRVPAGLRRGDPVRSGSRPAPEGTPRRVQPAQPREGEALLEAAISCAAPASAQHLRPQRHHRGPAQDALTRRDVPHWQLSDLVANAKGGLRYRWSGTWLGALSLVATLQTQLDRLGRKFRDQMQMPAECFDEAPQGAEEHVFSTFGLRNGSLRNTHHGSEGLL